MAINPPSDIVLDVVRAAEPARYQEALNRLKRMSPGVESASFDATFEKVSEPVRQPAPGATVPGATVPGAPRQTAALERSLPSETSTPNARPSGDDPEIRAAMQMDLRAPRQVEAYRNFEALVLSSFLTTMLPGGNGDFYGSGNTGAIWKAMLAEQVGTQFAKSGGVGIAERLAQAHPANAEPGTVTPLSQQSNGFSPLRGSGTA